MIFFFKAETGLGDKPGSRGLENVYKRRIWILPTQLIEEFSNKGPDGQVLSSSPIFPIEILPNKLLEDSPIRVGQVLSSSPIIPIEILPNKLFEDCPIRVGQVLSPSPILPIDRFLYSSYGSHE